MDRSEYDINMEELLKTNTYRELKKDDRLRPSGYQPPRIYELPKIHKDGVPLRPIV